MSTSVILQKTQDVLALPLPLAMPLDESVWRAWVLKGRAQDERSHAAAMKAVTWISLVTLLPAAAALWSQIAPYDVAVRFLLAAGGLALLYNPVVPVFRFSGEWQSVFVMASAVPFIVSLAWRHAKLVPNA